LTCPPDSLREDCEPRPDRPPVCRGFFDQNGRACPRPAGAKSSGA